MPRHRLVLVICAIALLTDMVCAAGVAGTWVGTLDTPMGAMQNTITLAQDGEKLTGSVKTEMFEAKFDNGKVDGNKISFVLTLEFGTLGYSGVVSGDEIKFEVTGPDGTKIPMVAKRQK
jgi:hypothetical protein